MAGKTRYIKYGKVSGRKLSLIVRCFSGDAPVCVRHAQAEQIKFLSEENTEVDEAYFGPTRVRGKRGRGASRKIAVVGLLERAGKVFTKPVDRSVDRCTLVPIPTSGKEEIMPILRAKLAQGVDVYTDG